jgi:hypothetical protein
VVVLKWLLRRQRKEETGGDERNIEQELTARTEIIFCKRRRRRRRRSLSSRLQIFSIFSFSLDKLSLLSTLSELLKRSVQNLLLGLGLIIFNNQIQAAPLYDRTRDFLKLYALLPGHQSGVKYSL